MRRTVASSQSPVAGGLIRRVGAALAGATAAVVLAWAAWQGFEATLAMPIQRVVYAGELDRLSQPELDALTQAIVAAPTASLESIQASARKVPWVREATVRRQFPDAVEVEFSAHTAFARWNDGQLVSPDGEIFSAPDAGSLPQLRGPDASAPLVVREYSQVVEALAPVGRVVQLALTPRGAWRATLDSGLAVALGRGDWHPRAERFALAWPRLTEEQRAATHADLRYPGGFALKRAAIVTPSPTLPQASGKNR